jgi:hypothetical protein
LARLRNNGRNCRRWMNSQAEYLATQAEGLLTPADSSVLVEASLLRIC